MRRQEFYYDLPNELIAREPALERRASRLLRLSGNTGDVTHHNFEDLLSFLEAGDLMVFNNTRVIPARLFGQKATGGKVEILVERIVTRAEGTHNMMQEHKVLAHVKASKSPKAGSSIELDDGTVLQVTGRDDELFELQFPDTEHPLDVLNKIGHMPLPPYIDRPDQVLDRERYQTVYAEKPGAVAAPTAGLHFDRAIMKQLLEKGVRQAFVTLHVGAGTFQPVRVDDIRQHKMHSEFMEISEQVCEHVCKTKAAGKRVLAVGTTSVRCLETAARGGAMSPYKGETDIFITPGYQYRVVDDLLTNFHLPESTLIMLVSALAGHENTMRAYREAVREKYRFFSYGDAMLASLKQVSKVAENGEA